MISRLVQQRSQFAPPQAPDRASSSQFGFRGTIVRQFMPLAIAATAVTLTIATAATAQASVTAAMPVQTAQVSTTVESAALLSPAQMGRIADILVGLTYFVLPIGLGIGLFLYDRHQAQRAATLKAQIKLLEKLWAQSPQA